MTVRPYQRGDDRRRVHWRASARHSQLMVRREEQPWQSRATLVLDNRVAGHSARQPGRQTPQTSSLEWAVTAAASIGTHLLARGYSVRLVTDEGGSTSTAWHDHSEGPGSAEGLLLEALATVEISSKASVGTVRSMLHGAGTASGLLVAVMGAMDADELASMTRLRHDTSAALAIVLDVGQWPGGQAADATGLPGLRLWPRRWPAPAGTPWSPARASAPPTRSLPRGAASPRAWSPRRLTRRCRPTPSG